MIERRFRGDLYDGFAVDEAVKTYEPYGKMTRDKQGNVFVVQVSANEGVDEQTLADELANYALGATIERGRGGQTGEGATP